MTKKKLQSEMHVMSKGDPELFYECLFEIIGDYADRYVNELHKYGVDMEYVNYKINRINRVETDANESDVLTNIQFQVRNLKEVMLELNGLYTNEKKKRKSSDEMTAELTEKTREIQKLEQEKASLEAIRSKAEEEKGYIESRTISKLEDQLKEIRIFLTQIPRDVEKVGEDIPNSIKKRLHNGIQASYKTLNNAGLWNYESEPTEIVFSSRTRSRKTRKETDTNQDKESPNRIVRAVDQDNDKNTKDDSSKQTIEESNKMDNQSDKETVNQETPSENKLESPSKAEETKKSEVLEATEQQSFPIENSENEDDVLESNEKVKNESISPEGEE